jgi:hypothetical protein
MIMEKTAREMYAKNREKIMQKARGSNSGFFGVGFYNNFSVLFSEKSTKPGIQWDNNPEFHFQVPFKRLLNYRYLDELFTEALDNYLLTGKKFFVKDE